MNGGDRGGEGTLADVQVLMQVIVPKSIPLRMGRAIISLILSTIRLPLCLAIIVLMAIESTLVSLVPLSFVRRPLQRMIDCMGCRLLLFVLGCVKEPNFQWCRTRRMVPHDAPKARDPGRNTRHDGERQRWTHLGTAMR